MAENAVSLLSLAVPAAASVLPSLGDRINSTAGRAFIHRRDSRSSIDRCVLPRIYVAARVAIAATAAPAAAAAAGTPH